MGAVSGTCPQCNHRVDDRHCDPKDFPGAKCRWWRCLLCKIVFDNKGRTCLPKAKE